MRPGKSATRFLANPAIYQSNHIFVRTFSLFTRAAGDEARGGGTPPVSELFDEAYLAYCSAPEVRLANRSVGVIASGRVDRQRSLVLLVNEQEGLFATGHA